MDGIHCDSNPLRDGVVLTHFPVDQSNAINQSINRETLKIYLPTRVEDYQHIQP